MSEINLRTKLCEVLEIEYPICLAGMGGLQGKFTPPELVAAVSNAGGLGVIGAAGVPVPILRERIRKTKELTDKPFGVDLLLPAKVVRTGAGKEGQPYEEAMSQLRSDYPKHADFVESLIAEFGIEDEAESYKEPEGDPRDRTVKRQVDAIFDEQVPVFAAGLGDPAWVVPIAKEAGAKVMGLSGSVRNAERQLKAGVDIVVAQGTEAGGHTGKIATMPLVPQIVDAVDPTPVVAAGGIADGRGIAAALTLGAEGVWLGTAFLASKESQIHKTQQDAIIAGHSGEFEISRSYTGKTARQFRNPIVEAWENSGLTPLPMPLQGILMAKLGSAAEKAGRHDLVFTPSGQASGLIREARPASVIMEHLVTSTVECLDNLKYRVATTI